MQIDDTFAFLLGSWTLTRTVDDRRTATHATFVGRAVLMACAPAPALGAAGIAEMVGVAPGACADHCADHCADYREDGELRVGGHVGPATRRLRYARLRDRAVAVHFADGGLLSRLDLRSGFCTAIHPCREDQYVIVTTVRSPDEVEERWTVTGPTKNYVATTTLLRVPDVPRGTTESPSRGSSMPVLAAS